MWTLQDIITAHERGVDLEKECHRCMILREPQLQRFPNAHWVWYCLIQEMPKEFTVSEALYTGHSELLQFCATLFGKTLKVSNKGGVDIDCYDGRLCKPAGFLITRGTDTPFEDDDTEWMLMFETRVLGLWRRRWVRES